jgi:hypothetical protein
MLECKTSFVPEAVLASQAYAHVRKVFKVITPRRVLGPPGTLALAGWQYFMFVFQGTMFCILMGSRWNLIPGIPTCIRL